MSQSFEAGDSPTPPRLAGLPASPGPAEAPASSRAPEKSAAVSAVLARGSLPVVLSLFVPGAGQFALGKRGRAALIFGTVLILGFLIYWAQSVAKVGQFSLGSLSTSWLWFVLVLFWLWNVYDASLLAQGRRSSALLAVVLAAIILYVIACGDRRQIAEARPTDRCICPIPHSGPNKLSLSAAKPGANAPYPTPVHS